MGNQQAAPSASPWRYMGLGVLAENRIASGGNYALVSPLEMLPMMQGELAQQSMTAEASVLDLQGNVIKTQLKADNSFSIPWRPHDTRVLDAPYLRRGEKVEIWRYADTKQYYWRELENDLQLRRGDRYRIAVSANSEEDRGANGLYDDCYVLDINGPGGMVAITTSMANGEKSNYTFSIDGPNGRIFVGDNLNNHFVIDTVNHILESTNSDGTMVRLNLQNLEMFGWDTVTSTFKTMIDKITESIEQTAGENITQTAGRVTTLNAGERLRINAPIIELLGQIKFMGPVTQIDGGQGYGTDCSFVGNTTWQGNMTATGTWTINGVVVDKHKHPTPNGMSDIPVKD